MARDLVFPPISVLTCPIVVTYVHVLSRRIISILPVAMVTSCTIRSRGCGHALMMMVVVVVVMMVVMMVMRCGLVFRPVCCRSGMMLVTAAGRVDIISITSTVRLMLYLCSRV